VELALGDVSEARLEAGKITEDQVETTRKTYSSQADDNAIISGIEGSESGLGWVGFAFAEEAGEGVTEISIAEEPNGTCVAPTAETIASNEYPLSRDLYIYVNAAYAEQNEAVASYVDYYLSDAGIAAVTDVGYVALTTEDLEATRATWEARETGTSAGQ
jgi:phosphate transport system substrate-binding protein